MAIGPGWQLLAGLMINGHDQLKSLCWFNGVYIVNDGKSVEINGGEILLLRLKIVTSVHKRNPCASPIAGLYS